jgi:hypothetical protein
MNIIRPETHPPEQCSYCEASRESLKIIKTEKFTKKKLFENLQKSVDRMYSSLEKAFKARPKDGSFDTDTFIKAAQTAKKLRDGVKKIIQKNKKKRKSKIKLIIFDFYGVVISGSYKDTCKWLARKYKMPWESIYKIFYHKYFNQAAEGKISERQFFCRALKELKFKEDLRKVRAKHLSYLILNKSMFRFAINLQKKGYKILLLSKNTPGQFKEVLKKYKIRRYFKNIINTYR